MKKALTIFVGFLHDFAAGIWLATVFCVWWLERVDDPAVEQILYGLQRQFFYMGLICVAVVILAGVGRTFVYAHIGSVYGEQSERLRRRMLAIKHIVLFTVFGSGTYWQWTMVFG